MIIQIEDKFYHTKRKSKKKQILLCDTLRPVSPYINSVRYRLNGENRKVPHYVINKMGAIFNLIPSEYSSNFTKNKATIVVCLENLGWLYKSTLVPMYTNWIGDVYRGEPFVSRWKDKLFWDVYTDDQLIALSNLVDILSHQHQIPKTFMHHLDEVLSANKFEGILSRCNYSNIYTDINPAFDVALFEKLLSEEKQEMN
jgi:hypothetical protein